MKFIVDAHLPRGLCAVLVKGGHEALHTSELPGQNRTKDGVINRISEEERRVVVSKDTDFFYSHLVQRRPWKLLLVKTGNVSAGDLRALFERHLRAIEDALAGHTLVEIDRAAVTPVV